MMKLREVEELKALGNITDLKNQSDFEDWLLSYLPHYRKELSIKLETLENWGIQSEDTLAYLEENSDVCRAYQDTVGLTYAFLGVMQRTKFYAQSPSPVHIFGETGTGKERVAKALHLLSGRIGNCVPFNCSNFADPNFQTSEIFGHIKGAFTGATSDRTGLLKEADNGTLFLDEVGRIVPELQAPLNRVCEPSESTEIRFSRMGENKQQTAHVRFVSAYNFPLTLGILQEMLSWEKYVHPYLLEKTRLKVQQAFSKGSEGFMALQEEDPGIRPDPIGNELARLFMQGSKASLDKQEKEFDSIKTARPCIIFGQDAQYAPIDPATREIFQEKCRFNEDLAYRLCNLQISIPPLLYRPLDAIAITLNSAIEKKLTLRPSEIMQIAANCVEGNVRTIRGIINEISSLPQIRIADRQYFIRNRCDTSIFYKRLSEIGASEQEITDFVAGYVERLRALWKNLKKSSGGRPQKEELDDQEIVKSLIANNGDIPQTVHNLGQPRSTVCDRLAKINGLQIAEILRKISNGNLPSSRP